MLRFLLTWFVGPLGNRLILREVGWCLGPLGNSPFRRQSFTIEGFELWLRKYIRDLDRVNLLMGVGFWVDPSKVEPEEGSMLYDRVVYDFDSEENPEVAVRAALNLASTIEDRYGTTPVVFRSGFKGAHVVIPLSKPTDWEGYQLLWDHFLGLLPRGFRALADRSVLQFNRLDRVPLTWNIKEGGRVLAEVIYPKGFDPRGFGWSGLRPLDPATVTVYKVVLPELPKPRAKPRTTCRFTRAVEVPEDPVELRDLEATPPCVRSWLHELTTTGDLGHYQRVNLVLFLKALGYGVEDCVELFRRYAKDFSERVTRYQVEYLYGLRGRRVDWRPYSCARLTEVGLCMGCGWRGSPVSYYRYRAGFQNPAKGRSSDTTASANTR